MWPKLRGMFVISCWAGMGYIEVVCKAGLVVNERLIVKPISQRQLRTMLIMWDEDDNAVGGDDNDDG